MSGVEGHDAEQYHSRLPPELLDLVRDELNLGILSPEQAREQRLELMQERTWHQHQADDKWNNATYSFCEH